MVGVVGLVALRVSLRSARICFWLGDGRGRTLCARSGTEFFRCCSLLALGPISLEPGNAGIGK